MTILPRDVAENFKTQQIMIANVHPVNGRSAMVPRAGRRSVSGRIRLCVLSAEGPWG